MSDPQRRAESVEVWTEALRVILDSLSKAQHVALAMQQRCLADDESKLPVHVHVLNMDLARVAFMAEGILAAIERTNRAETTQ